MVRNFTWNEQVNISNGLFSSINNFLHLIKKYYKLSLCIFIASKVPKLEFAVDLQAHATEFLFSSDADHLYHLFHHFEQIQNPSAHKLLPEIRVSAKPRTTNKKLKSFWIRPAIVIFFLFPPFFPFLTILTTSFWLFTRSICTNNTQPEITAVKIVRNYNFDKNFE